MDDLDTAELEHGMSPRAKLERVMSSRRRSRRRHRRRSVRGTDITRSLEDLLTIDSEPVIPDAGPLWKASSRSIQSLASDEEELGQYHRSDSAPAEEYPVNTQSDAESVESVDEVEQVPQQTLEGAF
jgi:hypothetical protein